MTAAPSNGATSWAPVIDVVDVSVELGGATVLRDVSLEVGKGQWVSVIGPNGAGKSTLLRAILGLVRSSGSIRVDGEPLAAMDRTARSGRVAFVPQNPVIPEGMTVAEYVLLGRTPHISYWGSETAEDLQIAMDSLTRFDLEPLAARRLENISGGERQRAVLARAITQKPDVLLLDEPTTGLDLGHQQRLLGLVDRLRADSGLSVIAAIHDLTIAGRYSDYIVMLQRGAVVASGSPPEVLTVPRIERHFDVKVSVLQTPEGPVIAPAMKPAST